MKNDGIDKGAEFDWGRASEEYAKYRDIYPKSFYLHIRDFGIGLPGQAVLDLGTGTGVLPRAMAQFGAHFTGADIAENQIAQAKMLAAGQNIDFIVSPAESTGLQSHSFDAVTAVQCWFYFDEEKMAHEILRLLKPSGKLMIAYMNFLPEESELIRKTEELVLKYNPVWSGAGYKAVSSIPLPGFAKKLFVPKALLHYKEDLMFTRESWRGRMRACRGVCASLPPDKVELFDAELAALLQKDAPEAFTLPHDIIFVVLSPKDAL